MSPETDRLREAARCLSGGDLAYPDDVDDAFAEWLTSVATRIDEGVAAGRGPLVRESDRACAEKVAGAVLGTEATP